MPLDEQFNEAGDDMEEQPRQPSPPLGKNQKIAAAGLAVFAVLIVALWAAQLKNNIYGPFNAPAGEKQIVANEQNSGAALMAKDTDADTLSDYDELNIYKTSPYLADTDSDGFKDGEEIKSGNDPNCPQGQACSSGLLANPAVDQGASSTDASGDALNNLLNQFGATEPATPPASGSALSPDQLKALKNIDAASLRELLLKAGMDKAILDKISDADLMKSYGETFNSGQ